MKLYRFMGSKELEKLIKGETLENTTSWKSEGNRSNSMGFCFFDDSTEPEERMEYLTGVVDMDYVVEMENKSLILAVNEGEYRDPKEELPKSILEALFKPPKLIKVKEYSTRCYSRRSMKILRIGIPYMTPLAGTHSILWNEVEYGGNHDRWRAKTV